MKKIFVVLFSLVLSACGGIPHPECEKGSPVVYGICINPGNELDVEIIKMVIETVHEYEGLDLDKLAKKYKKAGVTINWDSTYVPDDADGIAYWYEWPDHSHQEASIFLRDTEFQSNTWYQIYVLGHELLHLSWWFDHNNADPNHKYLGVNQDDAEKRQTDDWLVYQVCREAYLAMLNNQ